MGTLNFILCVYFCYVWVGRAYEDFSGNRKGNGILDFLLAIFAATAAVINLIG